MNVSINEFKKIGDVLLTCPLQLHVSRKKEFSLFRQNEMENDNVQHYP